MLHPTLDMDGGTQASVARVFWSAVVVLVLTAARAAPTLADGSEAVGTLQEVVVTATKRDTTVQNTPISLTAISGAEIQQRGLTDLTEIAQSVPGVSMRTSGPGETEFEMRGMASTGGNSPTVGFYLDDTPLTAPAASNNGKVVIDPNLYDLNRIEVLRGPQGTLYGSGSMGGTIKVVPNSPDLTAFDTSEELVFSDTDGGGFNHGENAMVNLPFGGGTAALRIVGSESRDSGWIDRIVIANGDFPLETNTNGTINPTGTVRGNVLAAPVAADYHGVNDTDLTAVRASLLWTPTDRLSITPSFFHQLIEQNGLSDIDSNPGTDAHYQPFDLPEPFSDRFDLGSFNVRYRLDSFDLTSTTSYWNREEIVSQDSVESLQWGLGLPSFYTSDGGIGPGPDVEDDKSKQTSEEIRLTSSSNSDFKWLVGYFYEDFESQWNQVVSAPGAVALFGTNNIYTQNEPTKLLQQAAFTELSYQLTHRLQLTAGVRRYAYNESVSTAVSGVVSSSGSNAIGYTHANERNQGINPKFTLSYEETNSLLLYTTAAKGFRPGGGTGPVPTSGVIGTGCEASLQEVYGTTAFVPSPSAFAPDTVWNYEAGEKVTALENRLTVNSAVYFENWRGVQQNVALPCGYVYQANSGNAHVYGSELEVHAIPIPQLTLSGNVAYTRAYIVSSALQDVGISAGTPVQEVPTWTSSASIAYRHAISSDLAFTARVENDYVGARTDTTYTINHLPAYDLTAFRSGVTSNHWSAIFFVKNAFNQRALLNDVIQQAVNMPTYNRIAVSQPLTIGIDLSYDFR